MTTEVSKLIWSDIKSTVTGVPLLGRSYPNLGLAVVIFVAVALVLGVSGIGSKNAPTRVANAQVDQGICDRTPEVQEAIRNALDAEGFANAYTDRLCATFTDAAPCHRLTAIAMSSRRFGSH